MTQERNPQPCHRPPAETVGRAGSNVGCEQNALIKAIQSIPGDKIVTLVLRDGRKYVFDIHKDGSVGYDRSHKDFLAWRLSYGMLVGAELIIRAFDESHKAMVKSLRGMIEVPWKNLYGAVLRDGGWMPLLASQIRAACTRNADTGESISLEEAVSYCSLSRPTQTESK